MAFGKQLPIRLDTDVEKRLEDAAARSGTTKSALIRLLAKTFVDQVITPSGINLPPNWSQLLPESDGRAKSRARKILPRIDHTAQVLACNLNEPTGQTVSADTPKRPVDYTEVVKAAKVTKKKGKKS
jgi:antitoxin component of RelBE/YafQ-DinJ toxin-antitoxin module